MPNPRSIQINIPNPCHQSWDEMTPEGQGRHCAHCQKTVIDFTTWSDTALYNFFSKDNGKVCGRFLSTQVDRPINIPYQPHSRLYRYTIALGLTLMFTQTPHLLAQNRPPVVIESILSMAKDSLPQFQNIVYGEIRGTIVDDKKDPLINAFIQLYQNGVLKAGVITDIDGVYLMKNVEPGAYTLQVFYQGYDSSKKEVIVTNNDVTKVDFRLKRPAGGAVFLGCPMINRYKVPLIDKYEPTKKTYTREELNRMMR